MGLPVNEKCLMCSKLSFKTKEGRKKRPECYVASACDKKRCYYRRLEHYRAINRRNHHYIKYRQDKCSICSNTEQLESHHIDAQCTGGEHTKNNIMALCNNCHKIITKYYQAIRGLKQVEEEY